MGQESFAFNLAQGASPFLFAVLTTNCVSKAINRVESSSKVLLVFKFPLPPSESCFFSSCVCFSRLTRGEEGHYARKKGDYMGASSSARPLFLQSVASSISAPPPLPISFKAAEATPPLHTLECVMASEVLIGYSTLGLSPSLTFIPFSANWTQGPK